MTKRSLILVSQLSLLPAAALAVPGVPGIGKIPKTSAQEAIEREALGELPMLPPPCADEKGGSMPCQDCTHCQGCTVSLTLKDGLVSGFTVNIPAAARTNILADSPRTVTVSAKNMLTATSSDAHVCWNVTSRITPGSDTLRVPITLNASMSCATTPNNLKKEPALWRATEAKNVNVGFAWTPTGSTSVKSVPRLPVP